MPGVGKMIMQAGMARQAAAKAREEGDEQEAAKQTQLAEQITKDAYAKLHHDMQHFVSEATAAQLEKSKQALQHVLKELKVRELMQLKSMVTVWSARCVQGLKPQNR